MRFKEWLFMLGVAGAGMTLANFIGFQVVVGDSLPGVLILLAISLVAVGLDRIVPLKLPVIAYCSIVGLLVALPVSPISGFVIAAVNKINFTAPLTMVGAFAGMSISSEIKTFLKQGWKMILLTVLVMTGTFVGSLLVSQLVLTVTGAI